MNHLDIAWQDLIDPISDNRVRLTPTDLHDRPAFGDDTSDFFGQPLGFFRVPIFGQVFHEIPA